MLPLILALERRPRLARVISGAITCSFDPATVSGSTPFEERRMLLAILRLFETYRLKS